LEINRKKFKLDASLCKELENEIVEVISKNMSAFARSSADMSRIDRDFLCHGLTMDEKVKLIVQRRRKFNEEKRLAMREKTQKLLVVGHIKEIQYLEWLENVVMVKKENGKWRMCVDFNDLNKACRKDSYHLPSIDYLVDSASSCGLLNFLDAFSGYNQIRMHPKDESKTTFMAKATNCCYKVMPLH